MKKNKAPEDFAFRGYVPIERVNFQIEMIRQQFQVDQRGLRDSTELCYWQDEIANRMVMSLKAKCASKKFEFQTTAYPSDWWQAFKKRFFPRWALKKWPVEVTEHTYEASAYLPDVAIPDHETYVSIITGVRRRMMECIEKGF